MFPARESSPVQARPSIIPRRRTHTILTTVYHIPSKAFYERANGARLIATSQELHDSFAASAYLLVCHGCTLGGIGHQQQYYLLLESIIRKTHEPGIQRSTSTHYYLHNSSVRARTNIRLEGNLCTSRPTSRATSDFRLEMASELAEHEEPRGRIGYKRVFLHSTPLHSMMVFAPGSFTAILCIFQVATGSILGIDWRVPYVSTRRIIEKLSKGRPMRETGNSHAAVAAVAAADDADDDDSSASITT